MNVSLDLKSTVGEWVKSYPATSRVFEQHQIDYCCGGKRALDGACWEKQLDTTAVLEELLAVAANTFQGVDAGFESLSPTEMCDTIEITHHEFLRSELPRLAGLINKVVTAHGNRYPWLAELENLFRQLREELVPHMSKEEQVLFPAIRSLDKAESTAEFPFGSLDNPIHTMEHEHESAGLILGKIRATARNFEIPKDACNTFRAMLDGLQTLEADLHRHIHKENNILFPRAAQLSANGSQPTDNSPKRNLTL